MQQPDQLFKTVSVKRYAAGSYVSGEWVEGAESSVDITAYIEPISEKTLQQRFKLLPEGKRIQGAILIITTDELNLSSSPDSQSADMISWRGEDWEVFAKDDLEFVTLEEAHHEYAAIRVTQ